MLRFITGRNEVVAKVMFLQVCVCPQGGRGEGVCLNACWDARPPQTRHPPGPGNNPPPRSRPPRSRHPPGAGRPPGKQTPAYGLRAAGTHPTGMHSCSKYHKNPTNSATIFPLFWICLLRMSASKHLPLNSRPLSWKVTSPLPISII